MPRLLHVIVASLREQAAPAALTRATGLANRLSTAEGAEGVLVGHSDGHLVAATWLTGPAALEPFAASAPHMEFVMRGIAPVTTRIWSATVETDSAPASGDNSSVLWAFALHAREGVFAWQVSQLLAEIDTLPGNASAGPTVEERERFRAAGVVCLDDGQSEIFERTLVEALPRWTELTGAVESALVPVLR